MCFVCVLGHFNHVRLFEMPWTIARQAPLSMGFSRQEYGRGLPFASPGTLPDPGIAPVSLPSSSLAGGFFATAPPNIYMCVCVYVCVCKYFCKL